MEMEIARLRLAVENTRCSSRRIPCVLGVSMASSSCAGSARSATRTAGRAAPHRARARPVCLPPARLVAPLVPHPVRRRYLGRRRTGGRLRGRRLLHGPADHPQRVRALRLPRIRKHYRAVTNAEHDAQGKLRSYWGYGRRHRRLDGVKATHKPGERMNEEDGTERAGGRARLPPPFFFFPPPRPCADVPRPPPLRRRARRRSS